MTSSTVNLNQILLKRRGRGRLLRSESRQEFPRKLLHGIIDQVDNGSATEDFQDGQVDFEFLEGPVSDFDGDKGIYSKIDKGDCFTDGLVVGGVEADAELGRKGI